MAKQLKLEIITEITSFGKTKKEKRINTYPSVKDRQAHYLYLKKNYEKNVPTGKLIRIKKIN